MKATEYAHGRTSIPDYFPPKDTFRGAFNQIDITPRISADCPIFLQGFPGPPIKAAKVLTPFLLQILLLEDDHYRKLLIITADIFGFGPELTENVRMAAGGYGLEPEAIILNASHTRHGPGTISHGASSIGPFHANFARTLIDLIVRNLHLLHSNLQECRLYQGKVEAQLGSNIRPEAGSLENIFAFEADPDGYYLRHTPFLQIDFIRAKKKIILINHGCPPDGPEREPAVSAGYPAYLRHALVSSRHADAVMFLQGASGNIQLTGRDNEQPETIETSAKARISGELLAGRIRNGLEQGLKPVAGQFFGATQKALLPFKTPPDPAELKRISQEEHAHPLVREWAAKVHQNFPTGNHPKFMGLPVQVVTIGESLTFITFPGPVSAELGQRARRLSRDPEASFILGATNGLISFLPTDRVIETAENILRESSCACMVPSILDAGTESALVNTIKELLKTDREERANGLNRFYPGQKAGPAFFVLSPGSSGTKLLADLLNTAANASVFHYPRPLPIRESLQAYWQSIDRRKTIWAFRYRYFSQAWSTNRIYGETGHCLGPFADILAEEIPDSRFIILLRNPADFVTSAAGRGWYQNSPWDSGLLKPREGSTEFDLWRKLTQPEKLCWLWRETYENILALTRGLPRERLMFLKIEGLIAEESKLAELTSFLGLEGLDLSRGKEIIQNSRGLLDREARPAAGLPNGNWNRKVERECGRTAARFGYLNLGENAASLLPASLDSPTPGLERIAL